MLITITPQKTAKGKPAIGKKLIFSLPALKDENIEIAMGEMGTLAEELEKFNIAINH